MTDVIELVNETVNEVIDVIARHKKLASFRLYGVLAKCLKVHNICANDPNELKRLETTFKHLGEGRRYIEKEHYLPTLISRIVFFGTNRTNIARYSIVLREATKRQIAPDELVDYMKQNGGINALYFARPLKQRIVQTKTLRLARSIEYSRDKPITLRLKWLPDNTFGIIESLIDD